MPGAIVYGAPPAALATVPQGAVQVSPLIPGSAALEDQADLDAAVVQAPPGSLERSYVLAQALRALKPGGRLTALALKDKGGARIGRELTAFGCAVEEEGRRNHRICTTRRPAEAVELEAAIEAGGPRQLPTLKFWSQPGVFSWDRLDPGSVLLLNHLPPLAGRVADLGCGIGVLARRVLESNAVTSLTMIDVDRRAIEAARRNIGDPRAEILWADTRQAPLADLDAVVTNPPFHDGGAEDRALGAAFIATAARALKSGGRLFLVANRHLAYEAPLKAAFAQVALKAEAGGYKVYEARR